MNDSDTTNRETTMLDQLLDLVVAREREVTMDTDGYTEEQVGRIVGAAYTRGLTASYDGRFILVRDLRKATP